MNEMLEHLTQSLEVPRRVLIGDANYSAASLASSTLERRLPKVSLEPMRRCISKLLYDAIHNASRPKHRTVGQDQRDFWRQLAKISGVKQLQPYRMEWKS